MRNVKIEKQLESLISDGLTLPIIHDVFNMQPMDHDRRQVIKAARLKYRSSDVEIDDDAVLSEGSECGCYLQAWIFVHDDWLKDADRLVDDEDEDDPGFLSGNLPIMLALVERAQKMSNQELERHSLSVARLSGRNRADRVAGVKAANEHQLQIARMTALLSEEDAALVLSQVTALVAFRNAQLH